MDYIIGRKCVRKKEGRKEENISELSSINI